MLGETETERITRRALEVERKALAKSIAERQFREWRENADRALMVHAASMRSERRGY